MPTTILKVHKNAIEFCVMVKLQVISHPMQPVIQAVSRNIPARQKYNLVNPRTILQLNQAQL
jgi:hypothetical protein